MSISNPKISLKGSSRTNALVLIDTHDRGESHANQQIDISEYINQIGIDMHIDGGATAQIGLPAIAHIEDIVATGDLVNIYLNTNRSDSNVYNRGNVRTFFGYVEVVQKSVSVSGDGAKITSYTITCRDFSKSIRGTTVYSNPHMIGQGQEGQDFDLNNIRKDFQHNLGGLTVLSRGIALQGTPRQIIIQNLMRTLGWGGQWILPEHYREVLPKSNFSVSIKPSDSDDDDIEVSLSSLGSTGSELSFLSNTFFHMYGAKLSLVDPDNPSALGEGEAGAINTTVPTGLKDEIVEIIKKTAQESFSIVGYNTIFQTVNFQANPIRTDQLKPAMTMFNLLCLDYMEDVDGYWGDLNMKDFNGSVYGNLFDLSNASVNEFFLDLRPSPLFQPREKDGLGVDIGGALPMVPAVVLREKPFTNYPTPSTNNTVSTATEGKKVIVGGLGLVDDTGPKDQLYVDYISSNETKLVKGNASEDLPVGYKDQLNSVGLEVNITDDIVKNFLRLQAIQTLHILIDEYKEGNIEYDEFGDVESFRDSQDAEELLVALTDEDTKKNFKKLPYYKDILDWLKKEAKPGNIMENIGSSSNTGIEVFGSAGVGLLAERAHSTFTSLPRPVFRSPDGTRVTMERKVGFTQKLLGIIEPGEDGSVVKGNFVAISSELSTSGESVSTTEELLNSKSSKSGLLSAGSSISDITEKTITSKPSRWHVLDFMSIYDVDVTAENYFRGDQQVSNLVQYFGDVPGNTEDHLLYWSNHMPIVTPASIYRHGLRVNTQSTKFVQHVLTGDVDWSWHKSQIMRWSILVDMWSQHAHEYLTGSINMVGMPGIRPGYRIDRPEMGMSFYVERVSQKWSYPGNLTTHIGVVRGQPTPAQPSDPTQKVASDSEKSSSDVAANVLRYYPPEADVEPHKMYRNYLGRIFPAGKNLQNPGTYTGSKISVDTRIGEDLGSAGITDLGGAS